MKIAVLAGGISPERNVSLSSGAMVCEALRNRGHSVALVDLFFGLEGRGKENLFQAPVPEAFKHVAPKAPDLEEVWAARSDKSPSEIGPGVLELCQSVDVVYLALHGACGEDGKIQAALELLGVPFTGSSSLSSAIAMDKDLTKRLVSHRVTTPLWQTVEITSENLEKLTENTQLPVVVKPLNSGSSIGVYIARTRNELREALQGNLKLGGKTVLEQYVRGREIQVAILDGKTLPPIEIIPCGNFYDYENKYQPGAAKEVCPAPIPDTWTKAVSEAALAVFDEIGLSVYARADFIVTESGIPYFLEINTLPGMTPTSLVPQEAAAVGIDYPSLCETIIERSIRARQKGL